MSKTPDYIQTGVARINEFLPVETAIEELRREIINKLPFGISGAYDFYEIKVMGKDFLLAGIEENEDDIPPSVLAKQQEVIQSNTGLTPIFIFKRIASYNFARYTKKNLNVVVGNRQVFLPAIFLIAEKETPAKTIKEDKAPVFFQLLVLYHLQKKNINGLTMREVAEKLKVSYATVNRGIRWMKEKGFIHLSETKEKQLQFVFEGKLLWDKALPFMDNPIEFIAYTPELDVTDRGMLSEQNALAEYSLLNGGPHRIAVSKEEYKRIKNTVHWDQFGESGIEVWKYDPRLLSDSGTVDRLSLYLMLKDYEDERVQIELENMMNEIVW